MHAIVEWLDEDPPQVSVVPQTWITNIDDTTHCYWPPQNIAKRLKRKDFETHQLPVPDENWSTHRIRCLRVEEATRKNPLTSTVSKAEVEDEIKIWLRGAEDRHGGRWERAKKSKRSRAKKNRATRRRSSSRQHSIESHGSSQRSSTRSHRGLSSSHATRRKSQDGDNSNSRQRVVADENDGRAVKKNRTTERRSHSRQHSIESRGSSSNRSLRGFSSSRTTRRKSHSPRSSVAIQGL